MIREGVGGGRGKDNTLITCLLGEGVGVGKKITDNHNTKEGPKRPDLLAVLDRSLSLTDQKLKNQSVKEFDPD